MERDDDDDYRMMMTILDVTAPKVHLPHFLTCNAKIHDGFQLLPARMEHSPRVNYCDPTEGRTCTNRRYLKKEKVYKSLVPVDLCYSLFRYEVQSGDARIGFYSPSCRALSLSRRCVRIID